MTDEIKNICIHVSKPSSSKPGGVSITGHYIIEEPVKDKDGKVVSGIVVMVKPDGSPVVIHGQRFRNKFHNTKSGELNEFEVATILAKDIKYELKKSFFARPAGFEPGPIIYPKGF